MESDKRRARRLNKIARMAERRALAWTRKAERLEKKNRKEKDR